MTLFTACTRRAALAALGGILAAAFAPSAPSMAQDFPDRPITLVVPFPAGGTTDTMARIFGERMSEDLGQRVVVENRSGASGTIAAAYVAKSPADGYTMFISNVSTHALAPHLFKDLSYDTLKAFAPVSLMTVAPAVLIVNPSLGVDTLSEFVEKVKAAPGKYNYASPGNGTAGHLGMERFKSMAGLEIVHVPFKGSGPARNAVLAGEPPMMMENIQTALSPIKAGKVKVLGVAGAERSPQLPDTPTIAEQGFPGFNIYSWTAFFVPAGTPKAIVDRLNAAAVKALNHPDTQKRMAELSTQTVGSTPEELGAFVEDEYRNWGEAVRKQGLKIDS